MSSRNVHKGSGSKEFREMKEVEYGAIEKLNIRPAAHRMFNHKPYSNDFGRIDKQDENENTD